MKKGSKKDRRSAEFLARGVPNGGKKEGGNNKKTPGKKSVGFVASTDSLQERNSKKNTNFQQQFFNVICQMLDLNSFD